MAANSPERDETQQGADDLAVSAAYRDAGSPYGDSPDGLSRWLAERLGRVNQGRKNGTRRTAWDPPHDPRIQRPR